MPKQEEKKKEIPEWKVKEVDRLASLIDSAGTVAVASLESLPSRQLQDIRNSMRDKMQIIVTKNSMLERALKKSKKKDVVKLSEQFKGSTALLLSKSNPFELFAEVKKNSSPAAAKPGQKATDDIIIEEGPTSLAPGPALSDLKAAGLDVRVEMGKIVVKSQKVLVKKGEEVTHAASNVLGKLGIEPMKIMLKIPAIYEAGTIYLDRVLDIDPQDTLKNIMSAYSGAFNLAYNAGIFTKQTTELFLREASSKARALAYNAEILTSDNVKELLAKANAKALALSSKIEGKGA